MKFLLFLGLGFMSSFVFAKGISTHVLDLATGLGGKGIPISLELKQGEKWIFFGKGVTDQNGRIKEFSSQRDFEKGPYRLIFKLSDYQKGRDIFFPEATVTFIVNNIEQHYHVPLVLSPYGYSTYRGN